MIKIDLFEETIFQTIKRGATEISKDVKVAFEDAIAREQNQDAKNGLIATYNSMELSKKRENPLCVDTGWPIFYFKVGNKCEIEGGFMALEEATRRAVIRATQKGYLRATMKHPLTGFDPGNNIGMNIPDFTYKFVEGDSIEMSYVAKGGGSECFGGTRHKIVAFADGVKGIEKFIFKHMFAGSFAKRLYRLFEYQK
jgi:tartrate/fumarate subfamily iron-sulfur-dependent hydro-lyase alpha chain